MATLKEYFLKDFSNALTTDFNFSIVQSLEYKNEVNVKVGLEIYSGAKFIAYYVPKHHQYFKLILELINGWQNTIKESKSVEIVSGFVGDIHVGLVGSSHAIFSKKIYVYSEDELTNSDIAALDALSKTNSISLTLRGNAYLKKKQELERPLAFISHDSRDKIDIAAPIALGLQKHLCPVWYDEYSLKVGDSLRETIEKGLKETRKCILILSPNFLSNNGWTKAEFNAVFTREIIEGKNVVLPVWHNVSRENVYEYSPALANKMALNWNQGEKNVVDKLYNAIMTH